MLSYNYVQTAQVQPRRFTYGQTAQLPRRFVVVRPLTNKKQTPLQELWGKVGPAVLGSTGVAIGAVVAWYTLRRKTHALDAYLARISQAQEKFRAAADKTLGMASLKNELTGIQEEVEMAVARKKLDQEQLIAVSNRIDRILHRKD